MYTCLIICIILVFLNPVSSVRCFVDVADIPSSLKDCGPASNKCARVRYLGLDLRLCFSDLIEISPEGFLPTSGCQMIDTDSFSMHVCVCTGDGCNADLPLKETKSVAPPTATLSTDNVVMETTTSQRQTTLIKEKVESLAPANVPTESTPLPVTMTSTTERTKLMTEGDQNLKYSTRNQVETAVEKITATAKKTTTAREEAEQPTTTNVPDKLAAITKEKMESQTSIITQTKADTLPAATMATAMASTQSVANEGPSTVKNDNATMVKFATASPTTSAIFDKSQSPITLSTKAIPTTSSSSVPNRCGVGCAIAICVLLFTVICVLILIFTFRKKAKVRSLSIV